MTDHDTPQGKLARWRGHRRAKRQQAREREYFDRERVGATGTDADGSQHIAPAAGVIGFGGRDGGGG